MHRKCLVAALGILLVIPAALRADVLDDELAAARKLLLEGKEDDAADKLDALETKARLAVDAKPEDAHANYILGQAAMYAGHDKIAERALDVAVKLEPKNARYALGRAQLALYQEKPKDAVAIVQKIVDADPKNVEAWERLGYYQVQAGQLADAQASYQKAADLAPKEAKYVRMVAQTLWDQHKDDDALAMFQKTLDLDPHDIVSLANMGQIYQLHDQYDKALAAFTKVVEIDPNDWRACAKLVQLNEALGKLSERDAARSKVFALRKAGKVDADSFCREQFKQGTDLLMVVENFELKGPRAVRYGFNLLAPDGKTVVKVISLGSYDEASTAIRAPGPIKAGEQMFHLDAYTKDSHDTLGMFTNEPSYEETRSMVKDYLNGKLKPLSATTASPATQGANK